LAFTKKKSFYLHSDTHAMGNLEEHFKEELKGKHLNLLSPPNNISEELLECLLKPENIGSAYLNLILQMKPEEFSTRKELVLNFLKDFFIRK